MARKAKLRIGYLVMACSRLVIARAKPVVIQ